MLSTYLIEAFSSSYCFLFPFVFFGFLAGLTVAVKTKDRQATNTRKQGFSGLNGRVLVAYIHEWKH
jgi:hypothetical protein